MSLVPPVARPTRQLLPRPEPLCLTPGVQGDGVHQRRCCRQGSYADLPCLQLAYRVAKPARRAAAAAEAAARKLRCSWLAPKVTRPARAAAAAAAVMPVAGARGGVVDSPAAAAAEADVLVACAPGDEVDKRRCRSQYCRAAPDPQHCASSLCRPPPADGASGYEAGKPAAVAAAPDTAVPATGGSLATTGRRGCPEGLCP